MILDQSYYQKYPTIELAKNLLGKVLTVKTDLGFVSGKIVETEAYLEDDPACHAYKRSTKRNKSMFEEAGTLYVYRIYGIHFCMNVVSGPQRTGEAVLIRALEPTQGIETMKTYRDGLQDVNRLCKGPGSLCKALDINLNLDGIKLFSNEKISINGCEESNIQITTTTRIGITKGADLPYRFYIKDNKYISKK